MTNIKKRLSAMAVALAMMLSNGTSLVAFADGGMYEGTYSVPINLQKSADDTGAITSRAVNQFTSPASLIVDAQGVISLEMELTRNTTTESTSTYQYYPKGTIQYKVSGSDEWLDAKVLETHAFSVVVSGTLTSYSRSDTRPSKILLEGLTESDLEGIEFKYQEYRIRANSGNASQGTHECYIKIDASGAVQSQTEEPVVSISGANVSITCGTASSVIYYTINGGAEQTYTGPFKISGADVVVKAYAKTTGYSNSVAVEKTYDATQTKTLGSNAKTYDVGTYDITVSAKKDGSLNDASSYDGLVVGDALLEVNADGTVNMVLEFQHGTMMSMDCYLEDVTYYNLSGSKVSVEVVETFKVNSYVYIKDYSPKVVRVPLLDLETEYFKMNAQAGTNDWYVNYHDFVIKIDQFAETTVGDVEVPEFVMPEDTGFFFGAEKIELSQGRYIVPTEILNTDGSGDISMTNDAMVNAYVVLEVYEDATAEVTAEFGSMVYSNMTDYVTDAIYYLSDGINSNYYEKAIINSTNDEDGSVTSATFKITNKALDGLYTGYKSTFHSSSYMDAYMSFDFANAKAYDVDGFGSDAVEYTEGEYEVSLALKKAEDITDNSMASDALAEVATLEVLANGNANLTFELSSLEFSGNEASATDIKFYTSPRVDSNHIKDAKVNKTDANGNPTSLTIEINHKEADGVYINLNVMGMNQDAYIAIDYTKPLPVATEIEIVSDTHKTEYYVDDVLSVENLEIKVTFNDESTQVVPVTSEMVTGFDSTNAVAEQVLTITYDEITTTYTVEIKEIEATPTEATVSSTEHKTQYVVGDKLDLTNLTIDVKYNDDSTHTVAVTNEMVTGFDSTNVVSNQELTITYKEDVTTTFNIEIVSKEATNIEVTSTSQKTTYYVDETLDVTGLQIEIAYNNGEKETLDVTSDMVSDFDSTQAVKTQTLTITYGELSTTYTVTILEKALPTIGFGSSQVELEVGTYEIPVSLKKASDITDASMATDALEETGILNVLDDGSAEITLGFTSAEMGGIIAYAQNIKYYNTDNTSGSLTDAVVNSFDENKYPTSVTMTIPNNSWDGVYINMDITFGNMNQDAYVAIAYTEIGDATVNPDNSEDDNSAGGDNSGGDSSGTVTPEVDDSIADGTYSVPVYLKSYSGVKDYSTSSSASMASGAVVGTAKAVKSGSKIAYTIQFQGLYIDSLYGHLTNMWYYSLNDVQDGSLDDPIPATITSKYNDYGLDGTMQDFPEKVTFTYGGTTEDNVYIRVYVDAMEGYNHQEAVLVFDWNNAKNDGGSSSGGTSSSGSGNLFDDNVAVEEETNEEKIETEAEVVDGVASVTKSETEITDFVEKLGDDAINTVVSLAVLETEDEVSTVELTITSKSATLLAENTGGIKIETQIAQIEIPSETLANIISQFEGDVKFTIENTLQEISEDIQSIIGDRPVIDFTIDIDGEKVTEFGEALTVKVPYEINESENSKKLGILYLPEENEPVKMKSARYEDGFMIFETEHFSTFAITYQELITMFEDILVEGWYAEAIEFVLEEELFEGMTETQFSPSGLMSRAMIMTVLHRLSGDEEFEEGEFWYSAGVDWAVSVGISDGTNVQGYVTREQLATLLYRYSILLNEEEIEVDADLSLYEDLDYVSNWALDALLWANSQSIVLGTEDTKLSPLDNATRAQVATMIMRYINASEVTNN